VTQKTNLGGRSSVQPSSEPFSNPDVYEKKEETQRDAVRAFFRNNQDLHGVPQKAFGRRTDSVEVM